MKGYKKEWEQKEWIIWEKGINEYWDIFSWQYLTEEEDIGFAVYFDPSGTANNLAEMECVFP